MESSNEITFKDLAESETFQSFFNIIRELTGVQVALVSPDGTQRKLLFPISEQNSLCLAVQSDPKGLAACVKTDEINCERAISQKQGHCYLCHAGLIDMAIPIFVNSKHIANMYCGQLLPTAPTEEGFKKFLSRMKHLKVSEKTFRQSYFKSPYTTPARLENILKLLNFFAEYFCEMGMRLKKQEHEHIIISRAKNYLNQHFREEVSLSPVAKELKVSPSYLSFLFSKETGINLTQYLQEVRIREAMKLMEKSKWNITQIAFEVGFTNLTHFNRVFRKFAHCAPSKHMAQVREKQKTDQKKVEK